MSACYLYIVRCADNSLYIGTTYNVTKRITRHNSGNGAQWTKQHGRGIIIYTEEYPDLLTARRREKQLKKWSRIKKERLINGLKP